MIRVVRELRAAASRHSVLLLLVGLMGVTWYSRRQWQRDVAFLREKGQPSPTPPPESWPRLPEVSVLVAAWNEESNVERHIQSFKNLRYPHKELVLCAGGSDRTYARAAARTGSDVTVLEQQPGEGKQRALRRCLEAACGSVIFLTDADCLLDDESFERTIHPIASGREQVCTGGSRPYPEMMSAPFVVSQAAPQLYSALHRPAYAPGILGRNCAIDRELLESSRGLDAPAPTGTDYVLAKTLARAGARIRQIPESRIATEYPTTAGGYIRQQRRWLRNVALFGRRLGAADEVRASLATSGVGMGMLMLPLSAIFLGRAVLAVWLVLLTHMFLSRLRYLRFASRIGGFRSTWRQVVAQIPIMFLNFVAWSRPLFDYIVRGSDKVW